MAYPSTITAFSYPTASSRLNNPSHSSLENLQSSTIGQIETILGLSGDSSTLGTVIGDLRSPGSSGGGHVQAANVGGTGQTSYNKGDILVASSSSVIAKLAVGTDGQVLKADSTQASGTSWSNAVANKVAINSSVVTILGNLGTSSIISSIFSVPIPGSTLGVGNGIRFKAVISNYTNVSDTYQFNVNYGNNNIFSAFTNVLNPANYTGTIEGTIVGNGSDSLQKSLVSVNLTKAGDPNVATNVTGAGGSILTVSNIYAQQYATSSIASSANQTLTITGNGSAQPGSHTSVVGQFIMVEKIL